MLRILSLFSVTSLLLAVGSQGQQAQRQQGLPLLLDDYTFKQYLRDFDKAYSNPQEYAQREAVFQRNVHAIQEHNSNANEHGYTLGINQFADVLPQDVPMGYVKQTTRHAVTATSRRRRLDHSAATLESVITTVPVQQLPAHVDWRQKGITTPVKNQYYCGSCW